MPKNQCRPRAVSPGFSLIEAAIVLGVIGTIIGGIWVVLSDVRENSRATTLQQQTILTVRAIRDYYGARALPTGVAGETTAATFTGTLRGAGVFPEDMCPANCVSGTITTIYNIYGGSVLVNIVNSSPYNTFNLVHASVVKRGCVTLGMQLSARSAELGLTSVTINSGTARTSFPIALSTLNSDCSSATSNSIALIFRVRN